MLGSFSADNFSSEKQMAFQEVNLGKTVSSEEQTLSKDKYLAIFFN